MKEVTLRETEEEELVTNRNLETIPTHLGSKVECRTTFLSPQDTAVLGCQILDIRHCRRTRQLVRPHD